MDLKNILNKKSWAADYMVDEITHIIKNFEKRSPGTKGEQQGAEYMAETLENYGCEKVEVESFKENPYSFYGWMWITFTLMFIGVICFFFKLPLFALILMIAGWIVALLEFGIYKKLIDWMFPEKTGHNVTAIKSCTGEVKRRVFFNGHIDAAWEWPVNYALGGVGFEGHMVISALGTVYYMVLEIIAIIKYGMFSIGEMNTSNILIKLALWGMLFLPFWFGMYFMWNRKRVVDGANDNLSGCYIGMSIIKALKDENIKLENTEIGCILCGSEEAGLRGAKAWCEAHKGEFDDVPTYIFSYDTIHDPKYLMANYRDLNGTVKSDKRLTDLFVNSAKELGIKCIKGWVPPLGGATDNAAFNQAGFTSTGITGLNHKLEDYYHTRRDTYDNMNKDGLADCYAVSVKVLEKIDNGELD